ncbi:hypothetical protein [Agromyces sp. ZXT2-6]
MRDAGCSDLEMCALEDDCPIPFAAVPELVSSDGRAAGPETDGTASGGG